jgi:iron complex transport system permease protein
VSRTTVRAPGPATAGGATPDHGGLVRGRSRLAIGLVLLAGALVVVVALSLAVGARSIPVGTVVDALTDYDATDDAHLIVHELRIPRTLLGLAVGIALGLAGTVMQGVTRNPLADPGLLGVSAGAAIAVVAAYVYLGIDSLSAGVWFAFAGAALASVLVYSIGSVGREGATPVKLALAGVVVLAALTAFTTLMLLSNTDAAQFYTRTWLVGSLAGRPLSLFLQALPFILVGAVMALAAARMLNALALGEDTARSLGQHVGRARAFSVAAIVVLVGTAVAVAGPIVFVGLVIPHVARAITGPDYRWVIPYSAFLGAIFLVGADIVGRVIARPGEIGVGIVTVLVGVPFFVVLVRRRELAEL